MELLNSKVNHPDYHFDHMPWGVEVMKRVNHPRVKILYDIYHAQIMDGNIIQTIKDNLQWIGHFHTGGVPKTGTAGLYGFVLNKGVGPGLLGKASFTATYGR